MSPSEVMQHNVQLLSPFIVPVLVYQQGDACASNWLTGGTAFIVRTTENQFLITAEHIFTEIDRLRNQHPVTIYIGGNGCAPLDISSWNTLGRDDHIDICTLQVPEDFNPESLNKRFFDLNEWPHPRAAIGNSAFIIGYPAEHRIGNSKSIYTHISPISDFVTDVGPRRFTIADENEDREIMLVTDNFQNLSTFGGMSGSPIFRMIENSRPEFIGVFSEGGDGLRAAFFGAHADFIAVDGYFDNGRIPPR